jgi:hypothetical protein
MPITATDGGEWIERLAISDLIHSFSSAVTRADWDGTEAAFAPGAIWGNSGVGQAA